MAYALQTETRSGVLDGPVFRFYLDALGEAVKRLRNGISFVQIIRDCDGNVLKRIEPEGRRIKLRPQVGLGQSGSVVTPGLTATGGTNHVLGGGGLSLTGWTPDQFLTVSGSSALETFSLAEGV